MNADRRPRLAKRSDQLLNAAADAYLDDRDPFSHAFLVEYGVTSQECFELSQQIGVVLKAFLRSRPETQIMLLAMGVTHGVPDIDPWVMEDMERGRQAMARLSRMEDRRGG